MKCLIIPNRKLLSWHKITMRPLCFEVKMLFKVSFLTVRLAMLSRYLLVATLPTTSLYTQQGLQNQVIKPEVVCEHSRLTLRTETHGGEHHEIQGSLQEMRKQPFTMFQVERSIENFLIPVTSTDHQPLYMVELEERLPLRLICFTES